jgi:hypothetical protein
MSRLVRSLASTSLLIPIKLWTLRSQLKEGWFTGKKLDDYIDSVDESVKEDFLEFHAARRVVNGTDKANEIAVLAEKYEKELAEAGYGLESSQEPAEGSSKDTTVRDIIMMVLALLGTLASIIGGIMKWRG